MSTEMMRILMAGALFVHGIGHTLGFWKPARSLPFLNVSEPVLRLVGGIVWGIVAAGFIASAMSFYGVLLPAGWWRLLAIIFAVISEIGLILFGRSWPAFNFIGATAMNIAILVVLLWLDWPLLQTLQAPN
jgi:hypothetical protein